MNSLNVTSVEKRMRAKDKSQSKKQGGKSGKINEFYSKQLITRRRLPEMLY